MPGDDSVIEWLLDGDAVIRWQVKRDLLDEPPAVWEAERRRTLDGGWVAGMLEHRSPGGVWPKGRWTDSVWALLLLVACGLPDDHEGAHADTDRTLTWILRDDADAATLLKRLDLCHIGFWLGLGAYFRPGDERVQRLAEAVLSAQLEDGAWNCHMRRRPEVAHSSFHTTSNVLENFRLAAERGVVPRERFKESEARALEFMLAHRLYRSDKTGAVISERFTHLTYPWHWHYTVLRGLDYMRATPAVADPRARDALELLRGQRKANGRWPLQKRIPGTLLVEMEKPGGDSRWNTLRALRIQRRADAQAAA